MDDTIGMIASTKGRDSTTFELVKRRRFTANYDTVYFKPSGN
jgi:hypothetical protein